MGLLGEMVRRDKMEKGETIALCILSEDAICIFEKCPLFKKCYPQEEDVV